MIIKVRGYEISFTKIGACVQTVCTVLTQTNDNNAYISILPVYTHDPFL
jgi:hypothetical protein